MRRRWFVPCLGFVVVGACFDFDATMAGDPPVGGDGGGHPFEAGVPDVMHPVDAPSDTSTMPEAETSTPPIDAGADTGREAGSSFCATVQRPAAGLFFCDDFDESPLPGAWQSWGELNGTITNTTASARSLPTAVDLTTMPVANNTQINVALRAPQPLPTLPATLRFAFSLEPLQIDPAAGAAIVLGAIDFLDNGGNRYTVGLAVNVANGKPALALGEQFGRADGSNFPDGGPPVFVNHPLPPSMPLVMNTWTDLVIEVDWSTSGLEGKVFVNGNGQLATPLMNLPVTPTSLQIGIGTSYVTEYPGANSPVWEMRYDNVVFTAQ